MLQPMWCQHRKMNWHGPPCSLRLLHTSFFFLYRVWHENVILLWTELSAAPGISWSPLSVHHKLVVCWNIWMDSAYLWHREILLAYVNINNVLKENLYMYKIGIGLLLYGTLCQTLNLADFLLFRHGTTTIVIVYHSKHPRYILDFGAVYRVHQQKTIPLEKFIFSVTVIDFFTKFTAFTFQHNDSRHICSKFRRNILYGLKTTTIWT